MSMFTFVAAVATEAADNGIDWPAWITGVSSAILAAGISIALYGLWDARKTRHGALITDLSRRFDEPTMIDSTILFSVHGPTKIIQLIEKVYGAPGSSPPDQDDLELFSKLARWPSLMETVGVLHHEGAMDTEVVYKMWGPEIIDAWKAWDDPVDRLRHLSRTPVTYRYFETLARLMRMEDAKCAAADARKAVKAAKKG